MSEPKGKKEKIEDPETERKKREEKRTQQRDDEKKQYDEKLKAKEKEMKKKQKRKPYKLPFWLRLGNIAFGVLFIALSFFALANQNLTVRNAVVVLAVILFLSGLSRIVNAFYDKEIGGTKRLLRFLFATLITIIAVVIFLLPGVGEDVLFALLAIGLIFQGLGRVSNSITHDAFPVWLKITQLGFGIASLIVGVFAIIPSISPATWNISVLVLLVIGFFISGLSRVTLGLVGLARKKRDKKD